MKTKNYTKEYLVSSIKYLRGELTQTRFRIQALECQIKREKLKLINTPNPHDNLWLLRDKRRYELSNLFMYRKELKIKENLLNTMYNKQGKNIQVENPNEMTTMEILEKNNPEMKMMGDFFKALMGE